MSNGVDFKVMAVGLRAELTATQSELAALRQELANSECMRENYKIDAAVYREALIAAEQRNSELVEWCAKKCEERAAYYEAGDDDAPGSRRARACQNCADVIRWNKPTE